MFDTPAPKKENYIRAEAARLLASRPRHSWRWRLLGIFLILALLLLSWAIVYVSGGTRFAYVHVSYIPIIAAAAFFGLPGGLIAAVLAGVAMGPLMPLDVAAATAQTAVNWLMRMGFFTLIGGLSGFVMLRQSRQLRAIRRHGFYDPLTSLPNRSRCLAELRKYMARQNEQPTVLLTLAIARFDATTSSFGHQASDELQRQAAERIQRHLPIEAKLFHISSGVFALILIASLKRAEDLAYPLLDVLNEPFLIEGVHIWTGAHAGLARQDMRAPDALAVLRASSAALREAEAAERGVIVYDAAKDLERRATLSLLPDLQRALQDTDEIQLHYQPKVDLRTGRCIGAEALVRWLHPERGIISPGQFIPLAEKTALIEPLTARVLKVALQQLARWKMVDLHLSLAVNVSVRNLESSQFPAFVHDLIRRYDVDPSDLELEVTESGLMTSPEVVRANLVTLRKTGISIALDDFGTGHSSLSYLKDLPADTLKLDRSFVRDLETDPKGRLIVSATIETAHKLGFQVVAEGIEDQHAYDLLRSLSCDQAQGFYISKPMPEHEFDAWFSVRTSFAASPSSSEIKPNPDRVQSLKRGPLQVDIGRGSV